MTYDRVTEAQYAAIKAQYLRQIRAGYEYRGFSSERIRSLMTQAEVQIDAQLAEIRVQIPNWLTPRRQRILAEIR